MDVKKKQKFYIDIYKTLNNLNPSFMKEISEKNISQASKKTISTEFNYLKKEAARTRNEKFGKFRSKNLE